VIILDGYAVLALLRDEPAAGAVRQLIESGEAALTVLGVAEVLDHLVRLAGAVEDEAALDVAQLALDPSPPLPLEIGTRAGLLRARHYQRRTRALSLADCVAAETARQMGASLATADPPLLATCAAEGIAIISLAGTD
jgi:predicted nucleic acid-binding protein